MHTISKKSKYLHVAINGEATYQDIKEAIEEEMTRDDYASMNDIWQFDDRMVFLKSYQFKEIVKDLLKRYPQQASRTKTAIVASSGISRAFAQYWIELAEILPYEIQIFMSLG